MDTPFVLDALIPIIVALFKQSGFPSRWNAAIAVGVYVVWTAVSLAFGLRGVVGPVTPEIFTSQLVMAATTGFISYQLFWRLIGEQTLEHATSFFKGPTSEPIIADGEDPNSNAAG